MIDQNKLVYLIDRTIGSKGQKLKKQDEYMYWSPFTSHHKPKLQINTQTQKWHYKSISLLKNGTVGFLIMVAISYISYLKK